MIPLSSFGAVAITHGHGTCLACTAWRKGGQGQERGNDEDWVPLDG